MLAGFGEDHGLPRHQAIALGRCLGGGMGQGLVCGAVSGALLILGLLPPGEPQDETRCRQEALMRGAQFREEFSRRRGSLLCRDLLGVDISTPEGRRQAVEQEMFSKLCPALVGEAAAILEEVLSEGAEATPQRPAAETTR
ncbi:MAG: C_GCAxxG_C_C family protein [Desulfarculus sp.]|nr:C_GCAxxG_C_C family protein [Desulfarculus sp.]